MSLRLSNPTAATIKRRRNLCKAEVAAQSRRIDGLTRRQSDALHQVNRLMRGLFDGPGAISYLNLDDSAERLDQIETLLRSHFGLTWAEFVQLKTEHLRLEAVEDRALVEEEVFA